MVSLFRNLKILFIVKYLMKFQIVPQTLSTDSDFDLNKQSTSGLNVKCDISFNINNSIFLQRKQQGTGQPPDIQSTQPGGGYGRLWNISSDDDAMGELINTHHRLIRRATTQYRDFSIENFEVSDISKETIGKIVHYLLKFAPFSMIGQLGIILRHKITNEYRFYYPGNQAMIFERPVKIISIRDVHKLLSNYNPSDLLETLYTSFPDSSWLFVKVVSIRCFLSKAQFL